MNSRIADIFVCIAGALFALASIPTVYRSAYTFLMSELIIEPVPWAEPVQAIVDDLRESSRGLLQSALTLMVGSWGVVVLQKDNHTFLLTRNSDRFVFACATFCLAMSGYSYFTLSSSLTHYIQLSVVAKSNGFEPTIPDLNSAFFSGLIGAQTMSMTFGAVCLALTTRGLFLRSSTGNKP